MVPTEATRADAIADWGAMPSQIMIGTVRKALPPVLVPIKPVRRPSANRNRVVMSWLCNLIYQKFHKRLSARD